VLLWPLYVWHITAVYPGLAHSRIMVEGFLTCFVVGFLGTALPRLLDVPRTTPVTADWMPAVRMSHYAYAAVAWIIGVLIWATAILPGVRILDVDHAA